jgi:iron complex transport system substrate-binding protein
LNWLADKIFLAALTQKLQERQLKSAAVCAADPEIIFASWCGKPVNTDQIAGRDGWHQVSANRAGDIHSLNSDDILQPGPRILSGISQMRAVIDRWQNSQ